MSESMSIKKVERAASKEQEEEQSTLHPKHHRSSL
jgi:hypothetical protein